MTEVPVFTVEQVRAAESPLLAAGQPLMARAAAALAQVVRDEFERDHAGTDAAPPRGVPSTHGQHVLVLAGSGAAALLRQLRPSSGRVAGCAVALLAVWNPFVAAWYTGKDDPSLRLLRFDPGVAEIWQNASSLFAGIKMLVGIDPKRDYQDDVAKVRLGKG